MTTTAVLGNGSRLQVSSVASSPAGYVTIYEAGDIDGVGAESQLKKATHQQSTAEEYIYGLDDGSEFDVPVNYNPTNETHVALLTAQSAKTTLNARLILPTGMGGLAFTFSVIVMKWNLSLPKDDVALMTFRFKVSGPISGPA